MQRSIGRWAIPTCLAAVLVLLLFGLKGGPVGFFSSRDRDAKSRNSVTETESEDNCSSGVLPPSWTVEASTLADAVGGDIVPVRSVADPYPSLHSVVVDPDNNRVLMSDSNRGSLLFYDRLGRNSSSGVAEPVTQVRGPATGMMFVAGVALDPANHEIFAVNNDIGDRMEVFPYEAEGNVKPKRILFVPHGSWGVGVNRIRDEIAITVEHVNSVVVYRRDAALGEAPLRVLHGPKTGLEDPHGINFDEKHNEISVANHGNWAPLTREESLQGELKGGRFDLPSITTYAGEANKDTAPIRRIQGKRTELNWPMGISLDTLHDEIAVASYGNDSILVFRRTDQGDAAPVRVIHGNQTGIAGPMGVSIDAKNDEIWVTNYREHTAVVFARTAEGNVAPKRVLLNAPPGTPAVGFGNPGAVAFDSKRDQILVPN
jgi:DNA-binding beta-propeller fold protein YncE